MACRLAHIGKILTYHEALCITEGALNGLNELIRHSKTAFAVTDQMIALNHNANVRIWVN